MHILAFVQISFIRFPINPTPGFAYSLFYKFNNENDSRARVQFWNICQTASEPVSFCNIPSRITKRVLKLTLINYETGMPHETISGPAEQI